jgi:ATP-dependent 26S proteasome regulatory subunit
MEPPFDPISPLREALAASPDNLPLRRHLADQLCVLERFEEAEAQYRDLLTRAPDDDGVRLALAQAYLGQGKTGHADILVELVTGRPVPPVQAYVLLAQIRIAERDFRGARTAFRSACELEPSLETSDVAAELGVGPSNPFELEEDLEDLDLGIDVVHEPDAFQGLALPKRPKETMSAAAGFAPEKSRLSLLVTAPLLRPDLFSAYGRGGGGGTLLLGPPGSGKSHLLRCVAGESAMQLVSLDAREFVSGESAENASASQTPSSAGFEAILERFFETAHRAAPCVVVIEHLDAIQGLKPGWDPTAPRAMATTLVRYLFDELGAQRHARPDVAFVATTERPWALDPLFVRSGRFDRAVLMPLPTDTDRREILSQLLADKPCGSVDLKRIARKTAGRRVTELMEIVDVATESALTRALESGEPELIREKALFSAIRSVQGSAAPWYEKLREECHEVSELQPVLERALRSHDRAD